MSKEKPKPDPKIDRLLRLLLEAARLATAAR